LLLTTAALIAAFGLIANSTAVIIGAMLVSPLMTPIIGSSLGLVRGIGGAANKEQIREEEGKEALRNT